MGFIGPYILGILSGLVIKVAGEILSPTVAELGAKLHAKVWHKPYIRGQLAQDIETLEDITVPLQRIAGIPKDPDSIRNMSDWLISIDTSAHKIHSKQFQVIKEELLNYTAAKNKVGRHTGLNVVLENFVKDNKAENLIRTIRAAISAVTEKKKKNTK